MGVNVVFHGLGNKYGNLFGIVSPGVRVATPTSFDEAKAMIDKLASRSAIISALIAIFSSLIKKS